MGVETALILRGYPGMFPVPVGSDDLGLVVEYCDLLLLGRP